jgi:hypothetical protein
MVVQIEDTTEMGTILLEQVYQGHYVKGISIFVPSGP